MKGKNSSCLCYIIISAIVVALVYFGFFKIKKGATIEDVRSGRGIEVYDRCITKKIEGYYSLSITTEKATYKPYERQKLEFRYNFKLGKEGCTIIDGKDSKRIGSTVVDTITQKRGNLQKENKDVIITGEIKPDSLVVNIFMKTDDPKDCKIRVAFPFMEDVIQILEGEFKAKDCGLKAGTAKLKRIS